MELGFGPEPDHISGVLSHLDPPPVVGLLALSLDHAVDDMLEGELRQRSRVSPSAVLPAETGLAITVCHFPPGTSNAGPRPLRGAQRPIPNARAAPVVSPGRRAAFAAGASHWPD